MSPRIAVLARCLGLSVLCLGLSLGCTEPGLSPQPPPRGVVDTAASTVVVDRPTGVLADGQDTAVVTVTVLRKADGSRLSGLSVSVTVEGEGASVLESEALTGPDGEALARVTSTAPGVKTVKASVTDVTGGRMPLTQTATVEFASVSTVKTLAFRSALPDGVAGVPLAGLVVEVQDASGAVVADSTAEVTLSLGSGGSVSPEGLLTVAAVNGVASFSDVVLKRAGAGYSFVANAPGFEAVASPPFTVAPGAPSALEWSTWLEAVTAGVTQDLEVTIQDAYLNTVTGYTGTVTLTSTDAAATLPAAHTFTPVDAGRFRFQGITFRTAGPQRLMMGDGTAAIAATLDANVSAAAPARLVFTQQPATPVSTRAALGTVKVAVQDAFGNTAPVTSPSVTLSLPPGTFTLMGTVDAAPVEGIATFTDLSIAGHGITHLVASAQGVQDVSSADVEVKDDVAPAKPVLTQTGATETGLTVQWTGVGDDGVQGQLASQELRYATSAISTDAAFDAATPVTVGAPVPPGTEQSATLSGLGAGKTYHVALKVTDAHGNSARSDSLAVSTEDPQVTQLAFTPQPSNGNAGSALADVKVSLLDARGDVVPKATTVVTLTLTGQAGFTAVPVAAVNGVATFAGLRVDTAGTFTFTATAGSLTQVSQSFTVGAGAAAKLMLVPFPGPVDAGASNDVTVSVTDAFGNRLPDYTGTVRFTSSDAQAVLPPDVVFAPADQGEKTVSGFVFKTAGTQSLTATDTATPALTATVNAEVRSVTATSLEVIASAGPFGAGQSLSYELVARDAYGNVAKGYASTVTFTSSDAQAVLPGAYTFTLLDEGRHTFSVELRTAGDQDVTVEDVTDTSLTASHTYSILPATVDRLVFVSAPTTGSVRQALADVEVVLRDVYGNTVKDTPTDVTLALAGGGFAQANPTQKTVDGVATFAGLVVNDEGTYRFEADADTVAVATSGDLLITDEVAPAVARSFSATVVSGTSLRLDWAAPGDDGDLGTAKRYELRYATSAITDATFDSATEATGMSTPRAPGMAETFTVSGLEVATTYFFALRTFDGAGNVSALATASASTPSPCDGYVCTPPAPTCAEDAKTLEVPTSVCVVRDSVPTCEDGAVARQVCPSVCHAGACTLASSFVNVGELVLSEVMHSPSAGTTEYLELTNTSTKLMDLNGMQVHITNSQGSFSGFSVLYGKPLLVEPGGRVVFAQDANPATNGGVPASYAYGTSMRMDSTGAVAIRGLFGPPGNPSVDRVEYWEGFPNTPGRAMSLASSIIGAPASARSRSWYWCDSSGSLKGGDRGTPGQPNDDCGMNVQPPVDFCNIAYPKTFPDFPRYPATITTTETYAIHSSFSDFDVTTRNPTGNDYSPRIEAQLGYGTDAANPEGWTWLKADFNVNYAVSAGSVNDQMRTWMNIPTPGTYRYGFRYRFKDAGAPWVYCDQNGITVPPAGTYGSVTVVANVKPPLTDHVVISEFNGGQPYLSADEIIELYNPTHADVDLTGWEVGYMPAKGSSYTTFVLPAGSRIRAHGFFLLGGATYTGTVAADVRYSVFDAADSSTGGHIRLRSPDGASFTEVDRLGYGTASQPEGSPAPYSAGRSLIRKAVSTSVPSGMVSVLGSDYWRGNAYDTNDNATNFLDVPEREPQNSASQVEFY
ncbi:lamin tail domain-containing protein [Corallococcus interemptor]|uniref:lamin tail domain-containing protein n=1 Tax=Corallococcus TaxID=83461 RepID=UPI001CC17282|nr:lamin tail domain-containing protein [Corallococcus sp. AS-1-12]MBZ4331412.1 lamin tail domain-containing protein [Corallococcus sp. AS-1-12]